MVSTTQGSGAPNPLVTLNITCLPAQPLTRRLSWQTHDVQSHQQTSCRHNQEGRGQGGLGRRLSS